MKQFSLAAEIDRKRKAGIVAIIRKGATGSARGPNDSEQHEKEWRIMIAMLSDVGRRFVHRYRTERAYDQLNAMDVRMLRDLGLDRPQIAVMADATGRQCRRAA